ALAPIQRNYVVSWRLLDSRGHTVLQRDSVPSSGYAPTNTWIPGDLVTDRYGMLLPADLPPGEYGLAIVLFDRNSGAVCTFSHGTKVLPGTVLPLTRIRVLDAPPSSTVGDTVPAHPASVPLGPLTLQGYDLEPGPYHPGDTVALRLYW